MDDVFQKSAGECDPRGRLDPAGFARSVSFQTWTPPTDLAPLIEHGWCVSWDGIDSPFHNEEVMHRPYVDLFVDESAAGIQGTFRQRRRYVAARAGRVVGLRFRPGGFTAIWSQPMTSLQDRVLELPDVFPMVSAELPRQVRQADPEAAIELLFTFVRSLAPRPDPRIETVNRIIAAVEGDETLVTVGAVAEACQRSERWVQQLFRDYTGIGLKWFLRRVRLLAIARAIRDDPDPDWADLAYRFGYASQQHFNTEFKAEIGRTPRQYWRDPGIRD